ncbi:leucine-rich repeat protein [Fusibacter ferrireducens]|uniref:Leucine-rich repeat protein n=1 Tax=Fusibacter ferrireducens TaxID=2785058 RepID=A0ABR9ZNA7_9FIRM|nr:leucine-rich repeat protein [Fusibacter ferrireducens]MBF4691958.1 leucine-rich repeat protein [Fusibacter ferrireducens]
MNYQKYKKFLSIYLITMMLIGLFSGVGLQPTFAGSPEGYFEFDSNTGTIISYKGTGGDVVMPSTINSVPVLTIGNSAFRNKDTVTSVTLPSSIKTIGDSAFNGCSNLKSITLNDGLETINAFAFTSSGLESIVLPNSVISIGNDLFNGCSALKWAQLSDHLTELPSQAFNECTSLETIEIPEGIKSIGSYTFGHCYALKSVKLPSTLESIGYCAFSTCTALDKITLPEALKTISGNALTNTTALKSIYFKGNFPTLEDGPFQGFALGSMRYYLNTKTGFETQNSYEYKPLYQIKTQTTSGSSISVKTNWAPNIDQEWFMADTTIELTLTPESGKQFKRGSLQYTNGITSQLIDSSFKMPSENIIVKGEFMPEKTTAYDIVLSQAAGGTITSNLSSAYPDEIINLVITPESGKKLVFGSLKYATEGKEYVITDNHFIMPESEVTVSATFEASDFDFDASTGTITGYVGSMETVVIPSSISGVPVIAIGDDAFLDQSNITSVTIPSSVKTIGDSSFNGCNFLTEITIPEGVTSMGSNVFTNCYNLQSIVLPESLTTIGVGTFYSDSRLKSIAWPASLTTIPSSTFSYCSTLKDITIPEGVTKIEQSAFYHTGFESITFPASLTTLESYILTESNNLKSIIFKGNAPTATTLSFDNVKSGVTLYHLESASGFTNPWLGLNTDVYNPTIVYTLNYDLNGSIGTLPDTVTSLHFGDTVTVSAQGDLTKGSDTFKGWNTMPDGTGDNYTAGTIVPIYNKDITLYATWQTNYAITIAPTEHGKVETLLDKAIEDTNIYVMVTPEKGYRLKEGSLKYNDGIHDYIITESKVPSKPTKPLSPGTTAPPSGYAFQMPAANVTISAEFEDENIAFAFDEATGTITKYYGKEYIVIIPSQINGVNVKKIGENAFANNHFLLAVTFSEGISSIGIGAFSNCINLMGLTLPESLIDIAPSSFQGSWVLDAVKIPNSVDSIYSSAFANSEALKTVYFEGKAPTDFSTSAFLNAHPDFKIIYDSNNTGFDGTGFGNYKRYTRQSFEGAKAVASDLNTLAIRYSLVFNENATDKKDAYSLETSDHVQQNVYLPVVGVTSGSSIVWQSSNPDVIATNGKVTCPSFESGDAHVTLTATASNNGASDIKTFDLTVIKKDHVTTYVSVGFNSNAGTTEATPELMTVETGKPIGSLPTAPTKTGYTFKGWNTALDGTGSVFLADTIITSNMTVYAQWQVIDNGSPANDDKDDRDDKNDNNTPSNPSTPSIPSTPATPSTPIRPTSPATPASPSTPAPTTGKNHAPFITETMTSEAKMDSSGKATASVTEAQMSESVKKAIESATKLGNGTRAQVEVKLTATPDAKMIETSMPKGTFNNIINSEIDTLKISSSIANLTFDSQTLKTISQNGIGGVNVTISKVDTSALSENAQKTVGDRPVFDFNVTNDGKRISQLGGNVTVEVPYTPRAGESSDALVVYYINDNGELEMINSGRYNAETGTISFTTNHFSKYVVGYNKIEFTDVTSEAWYSKAVDFVTARGIASGTGDNQFSPNSKLTRGQLLVMLMKAYDLKAEENSKDNFSDAGNTYYTGYLAAAKKLGITSGVGNNNYAPEKEINRQEMFTMLYNTLKILDKLPQVTTETGLDHMSDQAQVAPWAKEAMTLFVNAEIASGSAGKVLPKESTSRAQMAQVLYNLMTK